MSLRVLFEFVQIDVSHQMGTVILASRQYPQGRAPRPVIADLIRNPEGQCRADVIPSIPYRHARLDPVSTRQTTDIPLLHDEIPICNFGMNPSCVIVD